MSGPNGDLVVGHPAKLVAVVFEHPQIGLRLATCEAIVFHHQQINACMPVPAFA